MLKPGQECFLAFHFFAAKDTPWCDAGYLLAWEQFAMPYKAPKTAKSAAAASRKPAAATAPAPALTLDESNGDIVVTGSELQLTAGKEAGTLTSLRWNGEELLKSGPVANAWRAGTDNDGIKILGQMQWTAYKPTLSMAQCRPE